MREMERIIVIKYLDIISYLADNPHDIITNPIANRTGKWFCAYVENGKIVVAAAKKQAPKCSISKPRVLPEKEISEIYELYLKRKQGYSVSAQAAAITMNQVYWYGIFHDMGL